MQSTISRPAAKPAAKAAKKPGMYQSPVIQNLFIYPNPQLQSPLPNPLRTGSEEAW
jgi:hypothetical protein